MKLDRIAERMRASGLSQAALAREAGVTQGAINQILTGRVARSRALPDLARVLGVSVPYLLGDTDDPSGTAIYVKMDAATMADELGVTRVREIEIEYGMGGGSFLEEYNEERWASFDSSWLEGVTRSPVDKLFVARGVGDSMMPTLMDSDTLLVDRGQCRIQQQDRIWALAYGEVGMIKRLRRLPHGRVLVMSDNDNVSDFEALDSELAIIGRIVWIGRRA